MKRMFYPFRILVAGLAARASQMRRVLFLALLLFPLAQMSIAEPVATAWRNFPLGNWHISDNWSDGLPGLSTQTDISNGGTTFLNYNAGLNSFLRVGVFSNTSGTLLVSGSLTRLFAQVLQVGEGGGPGTGAGGTGTLNLSGGALAIVRSGVGSDQGFTSIGAGSQATGSMTVTDPGTLLQSARLVIGNGTSNGTLRIANWGHVQNGWSTLGYSSGSTGAVTVTGERARWDPSGELGDFDVASGGTGSLLVSDGGAVINDSRAKIGKLAGSNGSVTVTGAGSHWTNTREIYVGGDYAISGGSALLRIQSSGLVEASGLKLYSTGLILVENGSSTVAGLVLSGGPTEPVTGGTLGDLVVGNTTSGRMEIRSGGVLLTNRGYMDGTGGTGSTLVTGAGSKWTASGSNWVGNSGAGSLEITNGGALSSLGHGYLGFSVNAYGSVLVNGTGSTWTMAGNLYVGGNGAGPGGTGLLRIDNGGMVNAATATIYNTGTLAGGGTLSAVTVNNSGTVAPGNSAGRLTINGNYNQTSAGTLAIELGGYLPGTEHDQLAVSGSAIVGGTLNLTLLNGFRPIAGDTFQIITSSSQSGNFSTINCPGFTVRSDASPSGIVLTITGGTVDAVVTNTNDGGAGSLRAIITNALAGCTIVFAANVRGAISLTSGELLINKNLTIKGPGANLLTVQRSAAAGTPNFRIFKIAPASVNATISGLTIANGKATNVNGGAIDNSGSLTLTNCAVSDNGASSSISTGGSGGGVYNNNATLTLNNCTFARNVVNRSSGAIFNEGGTIVATNCTFSGNTANFTGAIATFGGDANAASVTLRNCTISGNQSMISAFGSTAGGVATSGVSTVRVSNTIIAGNTDPSGGPPDVNGAFTSDGHNLIGISTGSTGFTDGVNGDQVGGISVPKNPNLDTLKNNGGPTNTMALLSGSIAINAGNSALAPFADQRGYFRAGASDIGAYEFAGLPWELPVISFTRSGNDIVITFQIPLDPASDAQYRVRGSSDLGNWTTIASKDGDGPWSGTAAVTTDAPVGGLTNVTVTESLSPGTARRFYRLAGEEP